MRSFLLLTLLFFLSSCINKEKAKSLAGQGSVLENGFGSGEATSLGFLITAVTPSAGSTGGNYNITISGSLFDSSTSFTIDGVSCLTVTIVSSSSAICKVPPGSTGLKNVTATKPGSTNTLSLGYQYVGAATATGVLPATIPATIPTLITITGTNFVGGATVNISHPSLVLSPCQSVNVVNSTTITCYSPALTAGQSHSIEASAILASVVVTNPDGTQASLNNSLDLTPAPQYTSMSFGASGVTAPPTNGVLHSGAAAYTLTITGNYFTAGLTVQVNGTNSALCSFVTTTTITCTALASVGGAETQGNYNLLITNADLQSVTSSVLFVEKPSITSTTPTNVRYTGGDIAILNGSGLGLNPTITIYNNANTVLLGTCSLSTSVPVSCTTPVLGSAQATTIRLTNDYGYRTTYNPFNFITATVLTYTGTTIGRVVQGSSYNHTITISNPSLTVAATSISIDTSALAAPFTYVSTTCGATLGTTTSCNLVINFSPTGLGVYKSGSVIFNYNDGVNSQSISKVISGLGIELDTIFTTLDYGTIPFGNNHAAAPARFTKPVLLMNRGKSTVTINSGAFATGTEFSHTGGGVFPGTGFDEPGLNYLCAGTLAAGAKCVASIDFTPTSTGAKSDTYTLTYNTSFTKSVALTGTGDVATSTTCNPASTTFNAHGSGTLGSPYLICSEAQFTDLISKTQANLASSRTFYYKQTADITFTAPLANAVYSGAGFSYDGGGYRLINPIITQAGVNYKALFYSAGAEIVRNIQAYNSNITGGDFSTSIGSYRIGVVNSFAYGQVSGSGYVGGITDGTSSGLSVNGSYFLGTITCTSNFCGGISGYGYNILNSFSHGSISGASYTGGIRGISVGFTLLNSSSTMNISAANYVGGISGEENSSVTNVHFFGQIIASTYVGGIAGRTNNGTVITQSSFNGTISASTAVGGIIGGSYPTGGDTSNIRETVSNGTITASSSCGGLYGEATAYYNLSISDSFNLSIVNCTSAAGGTTGAVHPSHSETVSRTYVATPLGEALFPSAGANLYVIANQISAGIYSQVYSGVFYLSGIATNQAITNVYDLNEAQMQTQSVFETLGSFDFTGGTGKWKYSTLLPTNGYPYPMLQWMPNTWMP